MMKNYLGTFICLVVVIQGHKYVAPVPVFVENGMRGWLQAVCLIAYISQSFTVQNVNLVHIIDTPGFQLS